MGNRFRFRMTAEGTNLPMLDGILQGCVENLVDALVDLILSGVKQGTATATIGHEHLKIAKPNSMLSLTRSQ
jgi:uncharacterized protein YhfF